VLAELDDRSVEDALAGAFGVALAFLTAGRPAGWVHRVTLT
jgi:hypothetical protein